MSSETSVLPHRDSADYCIDPADLNPAERSTPVPRPTPTSSAPSAPSGASATPPAPAPAKQIGVLPAVNLYNGTVGFALPRGWAEYFHPEPWRIEGALRQAVKPAQWSPYLEVLTITVASAENRTGEPVHFSLVPLIHGRAG
ncbi:hypothetical protein [Arthrobacter castelli]|uniref:hypothetical protein n=1 Tax=Arthrobacter castelli TaxID=271431 RepID=UPI00040A1FE5|nr:hypothetical protein [Arthrobacter castelli]